MKKVKYGLGRRCSDVSRGLASQNIDATGIPTELPSDGLLGNNSSLSQRLGGSNPQGLRARVFIGCSGTGEQATEKDVTHIECVHGAESRIDYERLTRR